MSKWPRYPRVFEISTWVWLADLSEKYGTYIELGSVPEPEWDAIAEYGFDAVWLMGVWERSPAGIAIANRNQGLLEDFRRALPDFHPLDNVGSPYCVRRYVVDELLGGPAGLASARQELAKRGMRLILDFVPNHVAPDHPWVTDHPEYFIRGTDADLRNDPSAFLQVNEQVIACGRDPYFPAWPDVLQLNAFDPGLRNAVKQTLVDIAAQSDGVRCDMAMLFLNPVFERTWGNRAGGRPETEYWADVIPAIKQAQPDFLFIAEAYWDLEWELQQQGFDFCYDKRFYDRLKHESPESVRLHLCADLAYQGKLVRFLENHDEPRAAATFSAATQRAAAVAITTLPGARLYFEGQFEGRKVRLPVFLARRPKEPIEESPGAFYKKLLKATDKPVFRDGDWSLCERTGWPDNPSFQNLVCWNWVKGETRYLIVINLSDQKVQARVRVPWRDIQGESLRLSDALSDVAFERNGDEMGGEGLYIELEPWAYHFFECERMRQPVIAVAA
jgi:hypothetical protein